MEKTGCVKREEAEPLPPTKMRGKNHNKRDNDNDDRSTTNYGTDDTSKAGNKEKKKEGKGEGKKDGDNTDGLFEDSEEEEEEISGDKEATEESNNNDDKGSNYDNDPDNETTDSSKIASYNDRIKALEILQKGQEKELKEFKKKASEQQTRDNRLLRAAQNRIRTLQERLKEKMDRIKKLPGETREKFMEQQNRSVDALKRKLTTLGIKFDDAKEEVKRLKRFETQSVLTNEKLEEAKTKSARLTMELCQKHREIVSLNKTVQSLQKKVDLYDERKLAAMESCATKKLEEKKVVLERRRIEMLIKSNDHDRKKETMHRQSIYRNQNRAADQFIKDMSVAHKAHQNHQYAMEYCRMNKTVPKTTKINEGHFPKVNEDLNKDTPYLHDAYAILMQQKSNKALLKVAKARGELKDITKTIAKVDKLPRLKNQPDLDTFMTPQQAEGMDETPKKVSKKGDKIPSPFPGWDLVFDGFSQKYFFENTTLGEILFLSPMVDPNALSRANDDNMIDIDEDSKMLPAEKDALAKQLTYENEEDDENNKKQNNKETE